MGGATRFQHKSILGVGTQQKSYIISFVFVNQLTRELIYILSIMSLTLYPICILHTRLIPIEIEIDPFSNALNPNVAKC